MSSGFKAGLATELCSAATSLPFPPVAGAVAYVPQWGDDVGNSIVRKVQLHLRGSETIAVTLAELIGGSLHAKVIADDAVDGVDITDNELDITTHAYFTGDGPLRLILTGTATVPGGLAVDTDYWVITRGANAISLALTLEDALNDVEIDLTSTGSDGTGARTLADTADTERITWEGYGLLGYAQDGAISLTAIRGYRVEFFHAQDVIAYGLVGTLSAGNVSAEIAPVESLAR